MVASWSAGAFFLAIARMGRERSSRSESVMGVAPTIATMRSATTGAATALVLAVAASGDRERASTRAGRRIGAHYPFTEARPRLSCGGAPETAARHERAPRARGRAL